ncbi:MAG TPA: ABC-2 family transporter protein, partial [Candidatus Synoicihabitans sp.]|nr:ABC-2 family transporter protein [Candidatus Synoicihabitans sp.]
LSQFLPYYYQMYFPAAIFTGRLDYAQTVEGLGLQAFWVLALLAFAQFLWSRGLRRHTAVGG